MAPAGDIIQACIGPAEDIIQACMRPAGDIIQACVGPGLRSKLIWKFPTEIFLVALTSANQLCVRLSDNAGRHTRCPHAPACLSMRVCSASEVQVL
jgi:hypothetical protein